MFRTFIMAAGFASLCAFAQPNATQAGWIDQLQPIGVSEWNSVHAAHLLERAGFGGTSEEIQRLAKLSPEQAVRSLVQYESVDNSALPVFDESGIFQPGLDPFPPSRPAATDSAKKSGESMGVKVKPDGNRRIQPVANQFFYWVRASLLETNRVGYWWAQRMLTTKRPLEEKMALFWHGHFATSDEKVRDYRKTLKQLRMLQNKATGNFRDILISSSQDPAMLVYLDAGLNVKGSLNENFAREIMELFSMGVGNYTEQDIREAARAFTGWNVKGLEFVINKDKFDAGDKTFLGKTAAFDGIAIIDHILQQPVTAEFIGSKLYRYFVRQDVSPTMRTQLGNLLRENKYEIKPFLTALFLSRDFYSAASIGTRIKSPVDLTVSTYRKLGLDYVPGVPDFHSVTGALGQHLLRPPTVAGWAYGNAWITPGLLIERGNFARSVLFPEIGFIPPDRIARGEVGATNKEVDDKVLRGLDIAAATKPSAKETNTDMMAMSTMQADRDEDFNTRYASYRGWQMAAEKVKPILRTPARLDLTAMVMGAQVKSAEQVVDYLLNRFMSTQITSADRQALIKFFRNEIGTDDLQQATTYMEEPLRLLLHAIMSLPEYQLG